MTAFGIGIAIGIVVAPLLGAAYFLFFDPSSLVEF